MKLLHFDYETASEIELKTSGVHAYATHPTTRVIVVAWRFGDTGEVQSLDVGSSDPNAFADVLRQALSDPDTLFCAWNATFERLITQHVLGVDIPVQRWLDPMVVAHTLSFPGKLADVGKIVGLDPDKKKMAEGTRLITKFCKPTTLRRTGETVWYGPETHPEDWALFVEYCRRDVIAETEILKKMSRWLPSESEWTLWHLDQKINDAGYPIDRELVAGALQIFPKLQARYIKDIQVKTGVDNGNSIPQLTEWLQAQGGEFPDIGADTIRRALANDDLSPELREVLELRLLAASTSPKKYSAIDRATSADGRLRHTLQFRGASRTGRWAGRVTQFQNMPRPTKAVEKPEDMARAADAIRTGDIDLMLTLYDNPMKILSSCIRPSIRAPEGRILGIADLASIENVVLGWLARCEKTLGEFRNGMDPYLAFGVYVYGQPYEELLAEKKAGNKAKRNFLKPGKLGAGYRLGGGEEREGGIKTGLWGYAENMGTKMSREEAHNHVRVYREAYPAIVQFWYDLERAAVDVVEGRKPRVVVGHLSFHLSGPFLVMGLPSGRNLYYCRPQIKRTENPWGRASKNLTYEGLDQGPGRWRRLETHGGKLAENATQAVAADILACGLLAADAAGMEIIGHVHDEIITLLWEGRGYRVEDLITCMVQPPAWARDIPLNAEGFESKFYRKD